MHEIQSTGTQFEEWLTLKFSDAGWAVDDPTTKKQIMLTAHLILGDTGHDWTQLAEALDITLDELTAAYLPEKRQRDTAELREHPDLAGLEHELGTD
ncbi:hypothetical protein [Streptomyces sp. CBMA152]|uniref:hypothetical protein n=1 Tax=Streptomyces sp. CBMA152 TaxID=1896312 RepID=UPI0016607B95|nr:hypothetical protein [Streptomyces sp. CBMA152]MBD0743538.1 hypothetical protein [Streptomyces sp. CBMA152]